MDFISARSLRRIAAVTAVFLAICLFLANVLLSVHGAATNLRLYDDLWARYDVPAETGMTIGELSRAGQTLTGYLTGGLDTPQLTVTIFGQERPLYNPDEMTHLEDVKDLFRTGLTAEWISTAAAFAGTVFLITSRNRKAASRAFYAAGAASMLILILLAIPASMDFTGWWTNFHLVTFTNDLWLLDPSTDWLVKMFPESFFFAIVERIGLHAGVTALMLLASGFLIGRHP